MKKINARVLACTGVLLAGMFVCALAGCNGKAPTPSERYQAQLALVENQSAEGYCTAMLTRLEAEIANREDILLGSGSQSATPSVYAQMIAKKSEIAQTEAALVRQRNELKELEDTLTFRGDRRINDVMVQLESTNSNKETVQELAYLYKVSRFLQHSDYEQVHLASVHFLQTQLKRLESGAEQCEVSEFYRDATAGGTSTSVPSTIPFPALLPADLNSAQKQ
jgi:hypothetical protein